MKFAVTLISPAGYLHSAALAEVAETIHHGLRSLGHDSVLTADASIPGRQHIVLGSNLLPRYPQPLADDAILYNLEQVELGSNWFRPKLIELFRSHLLWDYSAQNATALGTLGIRVARVLPIGYVGELTRITLVPEPDIDVLFFGSINPRRQEIIDRMRAAGLRVHAAFGVYGDARDALIARASLVLNLHYYEAKVLEMVRISYLLANRCAVLSERSANPTEDDALAEGVAFAEYDLLAQRARELVDAPDKLKHLANRGFEIMSARPMTEYLRAALPPSA
jgi:hypothetical protein